MTGFPLVHSAVAAEGHTAHSSFAIWQFIISNGMERSNRKSRTRMANVSHVADVQCRLGSCGTCLPASLRAALPCAAVWLCGSSPHPRSPLGSICSWNCSALGFALPSECHYDVLKSDYPLCHYLKGSRKGWPCLCVCTLWRNAVLLEFGSRTSIGTSGGERPQPYR